MRQTAFSLGMQFLLQWNNANASVGAYKGPSDQVMEWYMNGVCLDAFVCVCV